jgi:glycosyltransferase involved in cell wall biosynthesis
MTKVLQIYKTCYPESIGGVEQVIASISQGLSRHNIANDVLAITDKKYFYSTIMGDAVVNFCPQTIQMSSCPVSIQFVRYLKEIAPSYDILHYHFPFPFGDFAHLINQLNTPYVITYHSDIVKQTVLKWLYYPLMYCFFKKASAITVTSNNLKRGSRSLQRFQHKAIMIPIGCDENICKNIDPRRKEFWQKKVGKDFFIFIGVLRYYKGLRFLLEAVRDTDLPLVIVGSGAEERWIKRFIQQHRMINVVLTGRVSDEDKLALLALSYSVVAPAHLRAEAFCISLLEGLVFGKPLISTDIQTGTSFVNQHNKTGLVVPPEDPAALRDAMYRLKKDKSLYDKFKQGTVLHYQTHFRDTHVMQQYIDVYKKIIVI